MHEGVGYLCIHCDKQFYWKENLGEHQRAAHEGVKYPCRQCVEQFSQNGNLGKYQRQVYEGVNTILMQLSSYYI